MEPPSVSKDVCHRHVACLLDVLRSLDDGGRDILLGACKPAALGNCRLVCHELRDFIDESVKVLRVNLDASGTSFNQWPRFRCLVLDCRGVRMGEVPLALERLRELTFSVPEGQVHEVLLDFGTERCYTAEHDVGRSVSIVHYMFGQLRKLHFLGCRFATKNVYSAVCRRLEVCSSLVDLRLTNSFGLPERLPANLRKLHFDDWDLVDNLDVFSPLTQLVELSIGCTKGDLALHMYAVQTLLASLPPKLERLDLKFRCLPFCLLTLEPQLPIPFSNSRSSDEDANSWRALHMPLFVHSLHVTPAETNLDQLSALGAAFGLLRSGSTEARLDGPLKATVRISTVMVDGIRLHAGALPLRTEQLSALRNFFLNGRVSLARLAIYPGVAIETVYQAVSLLGLPQRILLYGTALSYNLSACFPWTPAHARTRTMAAPESLVPQDNGDRARLINSSVDVHAVVSSHQVGGAGSDCAAPSSAQVASRVESLLHEAVSRLPLSVSTQNSVEGNPSPGRTGSFISAVLIGGSGVPSLPCAVGSCPATEQPQDQQRGATQQQNRKAHEKPQDRLHREQVDGWLRRHVVPHATSLCWRALPAPVGTVAVAFKAPGLTAASFAALRSALGQHAERVAPLEGLPDDSALSRLANQVADEHMQREQSSPEDRFHLLLGMWNRLEELPRPVAVAVSHGPWWTR